MSSDDANLNGSGVDKLQEEDDGSVSVPPPTNPLVTALLTDLYQITMAYAYWKSNRHEDAAVFELFFRQNPFGGEYTIFCGLDECLKHLNNFHFSVSDIQYLQTKVPALSRCDAPFFDWLATVNASKVKVRAMQQGTVCFPRIPLMIIEAPLAVGQLLETTLLTLVNYPSLIATNAARMVLAAESKKCTIKGEIPTSTDSNHSGASVGGGSGGGGDTIIPQRYKTAICVEFGLRRAQGPDGGVTASKYSMIGGFVQTSNVQAGKLCGLNLSGTHAHAFVQSFTSLDEVANHFVANNNNNSPTDITNESPTNGESPRTTCLLPRVLEYRQKLSKSHSIYYSSTNDGELASFIAYATAFPTSFLCLIDTYDTLHSGLLNFVLVALVLDDLGYKPKGIRLDSGDLAYLSLECAKRFHQFAGERPFMNDLDIVASNDINEATLYALNDQQHAITVYGIGTNLVTCQAQPALGCVYKLVQISNQPRIKLSQEIEKVVIPGLKRAYRLYGKDGCPILDVMVGENEPAPVVGERIMCRHPFLAHKRAAVTPSKIEALHLTVFDQGQVMPNAMKSLTESQTAVRQQLLSFRDDILRPQNPTPYKVSVSDQVFHFLHTLWQSETPVAELA